MDAVTNCIMHRVTNIRCGTGHSEHFAIVVLVALLRFFLQLVVLVEGKRMIGLPLFYDSRSCIEVNVNIGIRFI